MLRALLPSLISCLVIANGALLLANEKGAASSAEDPYDWSIWIRDGIIKATDRFEQATRVPHPESPGLSLFNCEHERQWWGRLLVVNHSQDQVKWIAELPEFYIENRGHYVLSARWRLVQRVGWVIETIESTHMGNGSLWLFALEGQKLRVLMKTRAVDRHEDGEVFKGGQLQVEYLDGDQSKPITIRVFGVVEATSEDNQRTAQNVEENWVWDGKTKVFALPVHQR